MGVDSGVFGSLSFFFFFLLEAPALPEMKLTRSSMFLSSFGCAASPPWRLRSSRRQMTHSTGGFPGSSSPAQSRALAVHTSRRVSTQIHQRLRATRLPRGSSTISELPCRTHLPRSIRMDSLWPVSGLARTGPAVMRSGCCAGAWCTCNNSSNSTYSASAPAACSCGWGPKCSGGISASCTMRIVRSELWYLGRPLPRLGKATM
mmetsp:Transcript_79388/g.246212  ORF Transcript_79388/g.246212 Transcript_79388/m.246212 type:complete len:204 (+) Transcript_79388:115-726(+)